MLPESHPLIRRALRFIALPYCFISLVNWKECTVSKIQVMRDLLYIFFRLKYFPDNYTPCRLWEKDRKSWQYYYGSSYDPYQRNKLRKKVQRFEYLFLFDDKEVCEILCKGMDVLLPDYFGVISIDMNYRQFISKTIKDNGLKKIIIKPVAGQGGKGIVLVYEEENQLKVKTGEDTVDLSNFVLKERSIIQEVVSQSKIISNISTSSLNTIRVITLYTQSNEVIVISASMRFGVGQSFVDNWSAGGVAVGVDKVTGYLGQIAFDKNGKQYKEHPVSQIKFEGFLVPKWKEILKMATDVQQACPFFKLLGMDIALSENERPILIEVNPNPDIVFQEQTAGPLLTDLKTYQEFKKYNLLVNKFQENLY